MEFPKIDDTFWMLAVTSVAAVFAATYLAEIRKHTRDIADRLKTLEHLQKDIADHLQSDQR